MKLTESYWPATTGEALHESTVGSLLRDAAASVPDAPALTSGTQDPKDRRSWTYAQLLDEAERLARALLDRFEPGDHVAVWAHNVPEWILLEYALGLAGLVLVTVNPALRREEVKYILRQSRARGVFTVDAFRDQRLTELAAGLRGELPELVHAISMSSLPALMASADPTRPLPRVTSQEPAQIQYTSGTTGFPKGARLSHGSITNNARLTRKMVGPLGVTNVTPMPMFHTGGCVLAVLGAASARDHLVVLEHFDPGLQLELIETYRATVSAGVPTMLIGAIHHPDFGRRDIGSLRSVFCGGSMVPPDLVATIERSLGASFQIVYGQTELSPLVTMTRADDSPDDKGTTVGTPLDHCELKVVDPATGEVAPIGTEGEICARGYLRMIDYFDMPEKTAETIDADGWLHTGDLGKMDARGYLSITGRLKDMIIRGGENVFPAEIENRLFEHPSVALVAVVGVPDPTWGEQVAAVIQPADAAVGIDPVALGAYCRETMASHKIPRIWYATDAFPLTGSGKIQKYVLVDRIAKGQLQPLAG